MWRKIYTSRRPKKIQWMDFTDSEKANEYKNFRRPGQDSVIALDYLDLQQHHWPCWTQWFHSIVHFVFVQYRTVSACSYSKKNKTVRRWQSFDSSWNTHLRLFSNSNTRSLLPCLSLFTLSSAAFRRASYSFTLASHLLSASALFWFRTVILSSVVWSWFCALCSRRSALFTRAVNDLTSEDSVPVGRFRLANCADKSVLVAFVTRI